MSRYPVPIILLSVVVVLLAPSVLSDGQDPGFTVEFSSDHGELSAYVDGEQIASGSIVEPGRTVSFLFSSDCYEPVSWKVNGVDSDYTCQNEMSIKADSDLVVYVESIYYSPGTYDNYGFSASPTDGTGWALSWQYGEGGRGQSGMSWTNMVHAPTVVGGYVYAKLDNILVKLDADTGEELKRVVSGSFTGFYETVAYGNGFILDSYTGIVYNLDLDKEFVLSHGGRNAYYHDGFFIIQDGAVDGSDCTTYCFKAVDQDTSSSSNTQEPVWSCVTGAYYNMYYGGSTVLFGDGFMLVAGVGPDKSVFMRTLDYRTGSVINTMTIDDFSGTSIGKGYLNLEGGRATLTVYGTTGDNAAIVNVGSDGGISDLRTFRVGTDKSYSTSLITSGGYGYVENGGTIYVYSLGDLSLKASCSTYSKALSGMHCNMSVSIHDGLVYMYIVPYRTSEDIYVFCHDPADPGHVGSYIMDGAISSPQFNYQQVHYTEDGSLIFINDSGKMFCVSVPDVLSTGVGLSEADLHLEAGSQAVLTATIIPDDATTGSVIWTSSDSKVATVVNGTVKAVSDGTCIITATSCDVGHSTGTCRVVVGTQVHVSGVTVSPSSYTAHVGDTVRLSAEVSPSDATDKTVTWSSSDPSVATVDPNGNVDFVGAGTCTITAVTTDGGFSASCTVTSTGAVIHVSGVAVSPGSVSLSKGSAYTLSVVVSPSDAADKTVTWSSSDPSVATVDPTGRITAVGAGSCTVTAVAADGGYGASCSVSVTVPVSGITLSSSSISVARGSEAVLTAVVIPADASSKEVVWSSSDGSVASVEGGKVHAISCGDAVITVKTVDGGYSAECRIVVTEPSGSSGTDIALVAVVAIVAVLAIGAAVFVIRRR